MCGGAGSRLWPASTLTRPKPFLNLIGDDSLFASTVRRLFPLVQDQSLPLIIAGARHLSAIQAELSALSEQARIVLEPEARDSAAAMAAAAVVAFRDNPNAIIAVVASDHYVPDHEAFRTAIQTAALAAEKGRIVTLGVRPTWPSPAFGYIASAERDSVGVAPVQAFVEKPSPQAAADYISHGYLWNSGNFITRADVLIEEIRRYEPAVLEAAEAAVAEGRTSGLTFSLSDAFRAAPKIAIDYAVMERTDRASVLPVDFAWSDVGSWDAVIDGGGVDQGDVLRIDAEGGLVRAAPGVNVAVLGVPDVIVVASPSEVLVTTRSACGLVRKASDHFRTSPEPEEGLEVRARQLMDWMRLRALPVWSSLGVASQGWFYEALDPEGRYQSPVRCARTQALQAYGFGLAGSLGWSGPGHAVADRALQLLDDAHARQAGGYRSRLGADGSVLDDTALSRDIASVLLAKSVLGQAESALPLLAFLDDRAHDNGGYAEAGDQPFQAKTTAHLLEAFLAWDAIEPGGVWQDRSDALADLAIDRLIDREGGFICDIYDTDWNPAGGAQGQIVGTGHQFLWSHLLHTWATRRGVKAGVDAAHRLFRAGLLGVDPVRAVAVDEMDMKLKMVRRTARLGPQTERLKAALALAGTDPDPLFLDEASAALSSVAAYLRPDGLWADVMDLQGNIARDVSPARSLHQLVGMAVLLSAASRTLPGFKAPLDLS